MTTREVSARWLGGYRTSVAAGPFEILGDEPESVGGTGTGPQPTDFFLASVASCFALALAHSARKRSRTLPELAVNVTGTYDGPRFSAIEIEVVCALPAAELEVLIAAAERVCYVTNTLRRPPYITITRTC